MSAATDTTPRTTDGDVAADLFPQDIGPADDGAKAAAQQENSAPRAFEWLRLLLATFARTALILAVSMAAWASVPALWGWAPTTVMSGSMEPAISTGDVVVVRPMDAVEYKPNRVVLVDNPDNPELLRLHRIVESNESGQLVLRGDANNDNDATPVDPAAVHGVGFLNIPYVGLPVYWIQTAQWLKVIAVVVGFIFMCWASTLDRDLHRSKHRANPPTRGTGGSAPEPGTGGLETLGLGGKKSANATMTRSKYGVTGRRSSRIGTAVLASALVLGTVPVASQAAFTATATNRANVFTGGLSCGATMLADGPTSLYQFDNDSGSTVVDSVNPGTGNGTFQGTRAATAAKSGPCLGDGGKSARFDGLTNSIASPVASMMAPTTFTYEMWFRAPQGSTGSGKLMSFGVTPAAGQPVSQDNRVLYLLNSGAVRFGIESNSSNRLTASSKDYRDGNWHHVAVTLKSTDGAAAGSLMELYIDGVRTNNAPLATSITASTGSWTVGSGPASSWTLDRVNPTNNPFFAGEIDNVAIYNRVIDKSVLEARYSGNRAAKQLP